ncbi:MAG TPA: hypothetical protein VK763_17035 [Terriglobales bacterium]|nr:hypothetical protein [Terriglobales bacterium]
MPEPRNAVKILVEASWQDEAGALQVAPAWIENKSVGGACIRVKTQIGVGSNLSIQGRWEQISGTAKYCRSVGKAYLVGIQRDPTKRLVPALTIGADLPPREEVRSRTPPVSTIAIQGQREPQRDKLKETALSDRETETVPIEQIASLALPVTPQREKPETDWNTTRISRHDGPAVRRTELQVDLPSRSRQAGKERKPMQRKWSELMHRREKQDEPAGNSNGEGERENPAPQAAAAVERLANPMQDGVASFPVELARVGDIYRTAGIMNPRSGYSIGKVIEMLHSEHTRELSKEAKRAAVLMALDVAGVPIDEVLQDAKARQDALDSYEAGQRRDLEAEWQRKAEENVQIHAELERVKGQYMARVARNLDGAAREKTAFNSWLTMKQQESQSISEAEELCTKATVSDPATAPPPALSMAAAGGKPV